MKCCEYESRTASFIFYIKKGSWVSSFDRKSWVWKLFLTTNLAFDRETLFAKTKKLANKYFHRKLEWRRKKNKAEWLLLLLDSNPAVKTVDCKSSPVSSECCCLWDPWRQILRVKCRNPNLVTETDNSWQFFFKFLLKFFFERWTNFQRIAQGVALENPGQVSLL